MSITGNVQLIREEMRKAAYAAGRDPEKIQLCAATKMNDSAAVREAIAAGVSCCGENRVQELVQKLGENAYEGAPIHFIGHLQTNKVKQVVGKVDIIQSVDSVHLLDEINKEANKQNIVQGILLEINIGREPQKSGFLPEELNDVLDHVNRCQNIMVRGLMAIPPVSTGKGSNCKYFSEMRDIYVDIAGKKYDNVQEECLSMGMSDDYADAIACGSTMIRVGTAIFGKRNYSQV